MKVKVIEREEVTREFGLRGTNAIIEHPELGRLLICDAYGGEKTMAGGAVRWRHGAAYQLKDTDTIESLEHTHWYNGAMLMDAVIWQLDNDRPYLTDLGAYGVEAIARSAGLV